jgi:hypothetical protein
VDREGLSQRWKEVVGDEIASQTRIIDLRGGTLVVEVRSAALLQELSTYYLSEILESLRERDGCGEVKEVRFRAGSFS